MDVDNQQNWMNAMSWPWMALTVTFKLRLVFDQMIFWHSILYRRMPVHIVSEEIFRAEYLDL